MIVPHGIANAATRYDIYQVLRTRVPFLTKEYFENEHKSFSCDFVAFLIACGVFLDHKLRKTMQMDRRHDYIAEELNKTAKEWDERIHIAAYFCWLNAGKPHGKCIDFWNEGKKQQTEFFWNRYLKEEE